MSAEDMTVGQRATAAIRDRAKQEGTTIKAQLSKLDVSKKIFLDWENKRQNPSSWYLQKMVLADYDIFYILIGEKNEHW